ncbi:hypothetical protein GLOIN_2v1778880 [Rhizophagus clarus]|uniref:Uncharacterized protein n=1 Tax=Rhizophagus clarus TaxID=94130 RepID=A0A8H3KRA2_9GLOM|nr:hypothetical protein GLOIN_2v1778880 [Rhizophagus clarus]
MSAITTKFVTDHQLTNEMSIEELGQYAPEMRDLLGDDREKRRQARNRLQKGYNFSKEQAFALVPSQRTGRTKNQVVPKEGVSEAEVNICCTKSACQVSDIIPEGEIIRETAQRIMRDSLSEKEVKLIAKAIAETSPNPVACTSSLSRLRKELRKLNAPKAIIEATKIPGITTLSNKIQKEKSLLCEDEGIHYLDHFSLESVKERLDSYDVSNTPDKQALADVMIMLCIRPAEIKDLRISNGGNEERAKQLLTWIQEAISSGRLGDPGTPGTGILSRFLKKAEFLPEIGKPLLPSSLRNLGAVFAVVVSGVRNLSKANTIASQALRHSPKNNTAPLQRYTIVNYRPRGMPYDQANPFMFFDEN